MTEFKTNLIVHIHEYHLCTVLLILHIIEWPVLQIHPLPSCYLILVCKVITKTQNCIHYEVDMISLSNIAKSWVDDFEDMCQGQKSLYITHLLVMNICTKYGKHPVKEKFWADMVLFTQIAKFMGPTWVPPGSCCPRWAPCWPHEPCYQGSRQTDGWADRWTDKGKLLYPPWTLLVKGT